MSPAFHALYVALWALVIFQGLVILGLFREIVELKQRAFRGGRDQLPTGTGAPTFSGTELGSDEPIDSTAWLGGDHGLVVLFVSPVCKICRRLTDGLGRWVESVPEQFVAVSLASPEDSSPFVDKLVPKVPVMADESGGIGDAFHVEGVPTAVALDADGAVLGYSTPQRSEELRSWVDSLRETGDRESEVPS